MPPEQGAHGHLVGRCAQLPLKLLVTAAVATPLPSRSRSRCTTSSAGPQAPSFRTLSTSGHYVRTRGPGCPLCSYHRLYCPSSMGPPARNYSSPTQSHSDAFLGRSTGCQNTAARAPERARAGRAALTLISEARTGLLCHHHRKLYACSKIVCAVRGCNLYPHCRFLLDWLL
jgi:hypothetical protein